MKNLRYVMAVCMMLVAVSGYGQRISPIGGKNVYSKAEGMLGADSVLKAPGDTLRTFGSIGVTGGLAVVGGVFYYYDGSAWVTPATGSGGGVTEAELNAGLARKQDTITAVGRLKRSGSIMWLDTVGLFAYSFAAPSNFQVPTTAAVNTLLSGYATTAAVSALPTKVYVDGKDDSLAGVALARQAPITLTTTGSSGAATFNGVTLNIPQYAGQTYLAGGYMNLFGSTFVPDTGTGKLATKKDLQGYYPIGNPSGYKGYGDFTAVGPLNYNGAGQYSIDQADGAHDGFLSSGDYTTFFNKQNALNGNGLVRMNGTVLSYDNSTYLTGNQPITLTGDATGSGTTSIPVTIANSGVTAGTYGTSTAIPRITVGPDGRITGVTTNSVTPIDTTGLRNSISLLNTLQGSSVVAADTINLLAVTGHYVQVTGTTTIRGLSPSAAANSALVGARRLVQFAATPTVNHNATTLILNQGTSNITMAAGDIAEFIYEGGVSWRLLYLNRRTPTGSGNTVLSVSPAITGTLSVAGITASGTVTANAGIALTGGTGNVTNNFGTAATTSGSTKVNNFGTGGVAGSTTNNNYGSSTTGAGGTHTFNGLMVAGVQTYTAVGTNVNAVSITPIYNQASGTSANTDLLINRTQTAVGSGTQRLFSAQVGGVERFGIDNGGIVTIPNVSNANNTAVTTTGTQTLTNKRITYRSVTAASYTTSVTIASDSVDIFVITAQAGALLFNAPSGTPTEGQIFQVDIRDNGTARALTWNAAFGWNPPSTTIAGKWKTMFFQWSVAAAKWNFKRQIDEP